MYIGWYGLGRFFIEATRTDSLYLANIKVSQLVAGTCVIASIVLIIVLRSIIKRRDDYKLFCETELSKAQLARYEKYSEVRKEKKELKAKIKEAKANGDSFVELQKEYDEKYGKNAKQDLPITQDSEAYEETDGYTSILEDDEDDETEEEASESNDEEAQDSDDKDNSEAEDDKNE